MYVWVKMFNCLGDKMTSSLRRVMHLTISYLLDKTKQFQRFSPTIQQTFKAQRCGSLPLCKMVNFLSNDGFIFNNYSANIFLTAWSTIYHSIQSRSRNFWFKIGLIYNDLLTYNDFTICSEKKAYDVRRTEERNSVKTVVALLCFSLRAMLPL